MYIYFMTDYIEMFIIWAKNVVDRLFYYKYLNGYILTFFPLSIKNNIIHKCQLNKNNYKYLRKTKAPI